MENCRRKNPSVDKFSFPIMPVKSQDSEFEFGCATMPGSPNTPADHLFFNGKLLPHVFPLQTGSVVPSYSRSTSRTSSISSKDSLMSSRSNSTNSRSSTCSSARTSTSEASERRAFSSGKNPGRISERSHGNRPIWTQKNRYGSCQRWQFIAPAPALVHQGSRSRKVGLEKLECKPRKMDKEKSDVKSWFGRKVLKSLVSACKECHAIKTSTREEVLSKEFGRAEIVG